VTVGWRQNRLAGAAPTAKGQSLWTGSRPRSEYTRSEAFEKQEFALISNL